MIKKRKVYAILFLLSLAVFIIWGGLRIKLAIEFNFAVEGYFHNYLESGSIKGAKKNLEAAIEELESRGLTEGQISIFWENPNNNIGLWYNNLVESKEVLEKVVSEETTFNQIIILEKQKDGLKGTSTSTEVKHPNGISIYPYNKIYFWCSILSPIGIIVFGLGWLTSDPKILSDNK